MGAALNIKPEIWKGVVAQVPFVDVINTMLDESIPLTTGEFDEWGIQNKKIILNICFRILLMTMLKKAYPALLVTTGYWDSQVQYWEPAKWVAKLRAFKTDKNPLYFYCNMDTGHEALQEGLKWRKQPWNTLFFFHRRELKNKASLVPMF